MLLRNNIRIASIQETHIPRDLNYKLNGYRIITTAAMQENKEHYRPNRGLSDAGVAIHVHEELEHHIVNIKRIDARIMQLALHSKQSHTPLTILCTYAPHGGKTKVSQNEQWGKVRQTLQETSNRHLLIWRSGANGQLGTQNTIEHGGCKIVGPHVKQEKQKKEMGEIYYKHVNNTT